MNTVHAQKPALCEHRVIQFICQYCCFLAGIMLLLSISGCFNKRYSDLPAYVPVPFKDHQNHSVGRFKSSYLVDQIDQFYRGTNPGPIGVTTFVNVDDLTTTSTFGRMYAEQVMSELAMRGFDVVELRHSDALHFLNTSGEFALSRDVANVRRERDLGAVVVGTYVVSPVRVYVNARLLDPASSVVVSAASVEMSKSQEIAKMLRGGVFPASLERIPVKHLGYSSYPAMMVPGYMRNYDPLEAPGYGPVQETWTVPEPALGSTAPKTAGKKK